MRRTRTHILAATALVVGVLAVAPTSPAATEPAFSLEPATYEASQVVAGFWHTCAIVGNGGVKCWGYGESGQLGLGHTANRGDGPNEMAADLALVDLGTDGSAIALAAGEAHTCALTAVGTIRCWGDNSAGQLGLGNTRDRGDEPNEMGDDLPTVDLGTGRTATNLAAGERHTCAILDNGTVKCWGWNQDGQLGLGDAESRGDEPHEVGDDLPGIDLGTGRTATHLAAGHRHTCAILDNGTVKCWGNNFSGQLGLGDTTARGSHAADMGDNLPAVDLGSGRTATAITAAGEHTCAVLDNASVKCWGSGAAGRLGLGDSIGRGSHAADMGDNLPAVNLGSGRTATAITAAGEHTCAVLNNASVKCWGANTSGQLGLGDTGSRGSHPGEMGDDLPTVDLGAGRTATHLAAGYRHTCAILDNATVRCWGYNFRGQLGLGDTQNRGDHPGEMGDHLPVVAVHPDGSLAVWQTPPASVAAGDPIPLRLRVTNLGDASADVVVTDPVAPDCARTLTAVAPGGSVTYPCTRFTTSADVGELTIVATADHDQTVPVASNGAAVTVRARQVEPPAIEMSTGWTHLCAILQGGHVKCWGDNLFGALGLEDGESRGDGPGEMGDALAFVDLGSGRTATQVAAGEWHTCAVLDDATVKCWGRNHNGQLGQGDTDSRGLAPGAMGDNLLAVDLGTGRSATQVTSGENHSCALLDNGTVKCWGRNSEGQLGLADTADRGNQPGEMGDDLPTVDLGTGRTATQVVAGERHTCAILDDGAVKCWGENEYGQLGLGNTADRGDQPGEMGDDLPTVDLGTGRTATNLAVDWRRTCALLDDATVKCWGHNDVGQLGLGDTQSRGDGPGEMGDDLPTVDLGTGRTATALAAGAQHSCALLDDDTVKCWGRNASGETGLGATQNRGDGPGEMGDALPIVDLGTGRTATDIATGSNATCALLDDSTVKCWGHNAFGQLGQGDTESRGDEPFEMGDNLPPVDLGSGPSGITGVVREAGSGLGVANAAVAVVSLADYSTVAGVVANPSGGFLAVVPPGDYLLFLVSSDGNHTSGFHGTPLPSTVTVNDDELTVVAPSMVPTAGTIAGTVTQAGTGTPLQGIATFSLSGATSAPERGTTTGTDGTYTLGGLSPGAHYQVLFDPTGAHAPEFFDDAAGTNTATAHNIAAGTVAEGDADLTPVTPPGTGASLTGAVTDAVSGQPLAGVWAVALRAADYSFARAARTLSDGTYDIALDPGTHKLEFVDPTGRHAMEWHHDHPYTAIATADTATAPSVVDADLTPTTGTIAGTVTDDPSGDPIAGVWVIAITTTGHIVGGAATAPDGTYTINGLSPASYRITFVDPNHGHTQEYWDNKTDYPTSDPITITAGTTTTTNAALTTT